MGSRRPPAHVQASPLGSKACSGPMAPAAEDSIQSAPKPARRPAPLDRMDLPRNTALPRNRLAARVSRGHPDTAVAASKMASAFRVALAGNTVSQSRPARNVLVRIVLAVRTAAERRRPRRESLADTRARNTWGSRRLKAHGAALPKEYTPAAAARARTLELRPASHSACLRRQSAPDWARLHARRQARSQGDRACCSAEMRLDPKSRQRQVGSELAIDCS